jgi:hypothetical protein
MSEQRLLPCVEEPGFGANAVIGMLSAAPQPSAEDARPAYLSVGNTSPRSTLPPLSWRSLARKTAPTNPWPTQLVDRLVELIVHTDANDVIANVTCGRKCDGRSERRCR